MNNIRRVKKIYKSRLTLEGAGVHLKRAFGFQQVPDLDPFLLLDDFHSRNPDDYVKGFPWHPHRGIETITYMRYGEVEHGDSMGNKGTIHEGDVQWMTAGSGIIHQEMPSGRKDGLLWGFQLWANLPASDKMMNPRYRDIKEKDVPVIKRDGGAEISIICGSIDGYEGPVKDIVINPEYLDVTIKPGSTFSHKVRKGHTVFAYVTTGKGHFDDLRDPYAYEIQGRNYFDFNRARLVEPESLVIFSDGDEVSITAEAEDLKFLLISGRPIGEPIAWYGPIVMNTQEELRIAFEEYENGTFIKAGGKSSEHKRIP